MSKVLYNYKYKCRRWLSLIECKFCSARVLFNDRKSSDVEKNITCWSFDDTIKAARLKPLFCVDVKCYLTLLKVHIILHKVFDNIINVVCYIHIINYLSLIKSFNVNVVLQNWETKYQTTVIAVDIVAVDIIITIC